MTLFLMSNTFKKRFILDMQYFTKYYHNIKNYYFLNFLFETKDISFVSLFRYQSDEIFFSSSTLK